MSLAELLIEIADQWLPRTCPYCNAPSETVLDDDGDDVDDDGTFVLKFRCCNCGNQVRVRTPVSFPFEVDRFAEYVRSTQKA